MDDDQVLAIVHEHEVGDPRLWFETLDEVYRGLGDAADLETFRDRFGADVDGIANGRAAAEDFVRDAELDDVKRLAETGPDDLVSRLDELFAEDTAEASEDEDTGDEEGFAAYLAEYSGYWDGAEETWPEFLDNVREYAEETFGAPARSFFERAAEGDDKHALFAGYGVTIGEAGEADQGEAAEAEDGLWAAAVEAYGAAWADWDGSEQGWNEYRDWFYDATHNDSPESYAVAYERLDPLNELSMPERIARLREYGFTIAEAADAAGEDVLESLAALFDEEAAAEARQTIQAAAAAAPALGVLDEQFLSQAFDEVLAEDPAIAELTPEEIQELIAEIAERLESPAAG